jgi:NADPH:quinone reductase-like Zn-dependent oxidoreductase
LPPCPTVKAAASTGGAPQGDPAVAPLDRQLPQADSRFSGLKVLVAGATGGVGRAVAAQLAAQGVPVRALVRDGVKAAGVLPPASQGVEIVEGDVYRFSTVARAMQGW